MNPDRSLKFMDSMTNAAENMGILMFGNVSLNYLIICPWLLLFKISSFACMEDCLLRLKLLIILELWKESRKFLMKDPCVICFGQIPMIDQVGEWTLEVQATHLDRILLSSSIMLTIFEWLPVPISSWCKDTQQLTTKTSQQFFQLQTTVTDVATRLQSWMWTRTFDKTTSNTIQHLAKETKSKRKEFQIIFYDGEFKMSIYINKHLINKYSEQRIR